MKIVKNLNMMRLQSGHDYLSFFSIAVYVGLAVICIVATAYVGPYWPGMIILAAIMTGLAYLYFVDNRAYTLTVNKSDGTVNLVSVSPLRMFKKTVAKSLADAVELHTVRIPGNRGIGGRGASDTSILFSIQFADKSTIGFYAYRPKAIEKEPFFTFRDFRSTIKTQEQDIYAPQLAKFMDIPLKTQTKDKISKDFITTAQYRDVLY